MLGSVNDNLGEYLKFLRLKGEEFEIHLLSHDAK